MNTPSPDQREAESHQTTERDRPPYSPHVLLTIFALKILGPTILQRLTPPNDKAEIISSSHQYNIIKLIRFSKVLFSDIVEPSEDGTEITTPQRPKSVNVTHMGDGPNLARMPITKRSQDAFSSYMWEHIAELARIDSKTTRLKTTKILVDLLTYFTGLKTKVSSIFWEALKSDFLAKVDNPKEHSEDTLAGLAGVYDRQITLDPESDGLSPHQLISIATSLVATQYLNHRGKWAGYFHNAQTYNPSKSWENTRESANSFFKVLTDPHQGWASLGGVDPETARFTDKLIQHKPDNPKQKPNIAYFNTSGLTNDPGLSFVNKNGSIQIESPAHNYTANIDGLKSIPLRILNSDCTQYLDTNIGDFLSMSPENQQHFIANMEKRFGEWKSISNIVSGQDNTTVPIMLSVIKTDTSPELTNQLKELYASRGHSMIHLDFRLQTDNKVELIFHSSHPHGDGMAQKNYQELLSNILTTSPSKEKKLLEFRAPLYPKDEINDLKDLLNSLELSDLVVGLSYNLTPIEDNLNIINKKHNATDSDTVTKIINEVIANPENIQLIINQLTKAYPELNSWYHTPNRSNPSSELESTLELLDQYRKSPSLVKDSTIATSLRNLLIPKISYVHLLDLIASSKAQTINCVAPIFEQQRLQFALVQGLTDDQLKEVEYYTSLNPDNQVNYQLSESTYNAIFSILELNLLEQSLSRLGLSPIGFLYQQVGTGRDAATMGANITAPELTKLVNNIVIETSATLPSDADWFVSAGSNFSNVLSMSLGLTTQPKTSLGKITLRTNLTRSSALNLLPINREFSKLMEEAESNGNNHLTFTLKRIEELALHSNKYSNTEIIETIYDLAMNAPMMKERLYPCIKELLVKTTQTWLQDLHNNTSSLATLLARGPKSNSSV